MPDVNRRPELLIGIQKPDGENLGAEVRGLFEHGGLRVAYDPRDDIGRTNREGIGFLKMRNPDITETVANGWADLAIVGLDQYWEYVGQRLRPDLVEPLEISKCTVTLGVRRGYPFNNNPKSLERSRIATSYVELTRRYLERHEVNAQIISRGGGEEALVSLGYVDAAVVISSTGKSFEVAGMERADTILESQAFVIADPDLGKKPETAGRVYRAFEALLDGIYQTQNGFMIVNAPADRREDLLRILPARKSPTLLNSGTEGWIAAQSIVPKAIWNQVAEQLYDIGVEDIIEETVRSMRPNRTDARIGRMMRKIYGDHWTPPTPFYPLYENGR